jgi:hypothetical protein
MAASNFTATVYVTLPWWTNLYIDGLKFFCSITGYQPDSADAKRWANFITDHAKVTVGNNGK